MDVTSNQPPQGNAPRPVISVSQADTKLLLAIQAHLRQLVRTAVKPDMKAWRRPVEMDQSDLVLASASLRALIFDHSPKPLLFRLMNNSGVQIEIETIETNLGLLLLSVLVPELGHVSEYIIGGVIDESFKKDLALNKAHQSLIFYPKRQGFEAILDRYQIWAPTEDQDAIINSSLSAFSNVGPSQLLSLTRRIVPLSEWGAMRIGYLKGTAITRHRLVDYVANYLGGVHYDSNRKPRDPDDAAQFRALAAAMDWDDQAIMHAALVGVGVACIEVLNAPGIFDLYHQCNKLLSERQKRLIEKAAVAFDVEFPAEDNEAEAC